MQGGGAYLGAQLFDSPLGAVALGGTGLLANDVVVVNDGGAVVLLLVVVLRDLEGVACLLLIQNAKIFSRLRRLFAFGIAEKEILETDLGVSRRFRVVGAFTRRFEPQVADLVLRVRRHGVVRKFLRHRGVGNDRGLRVTLLFRGEPDAKLRARGITPVRRRAHNGRENLDRPVHRRFNGDA